MTFWETIERGEYVMFALAAILLAVVIVWWVRGWTLRKQRRSYGPLMHRVKDYVVEGDIDNSRQLCVETATPGALTILSGLNRIGQPMSEVRSAMRQVASHEKEKMEAGIEWLRTFAVVSPLLGLGGTLVGVIDRLRDLGEIGESVATSTVCGAIAPTIVTTVAGLGVGIFALVALAALNSSITTSKRSLDRCEAEFTDLLEQPA